MSVSKVAAVIGASGHRDRPDHARWHPLAGGTPLAVCGPRALSEAFAVAAS
jgi:hypothetical protein